MVDHGLVLVGYGAKHVGKPQNESKAKETGHVMCRGLGAILNSKDSFGYSLIILIFFSLGLDLLLLRRSNNTYHLP